MNNDTPPARIVNKIALNERIIFALDFADPAQALGWVERLDGRIRFFKVGLQLFTAGWWPVVDAITARGNKVMLDLKFFDIPETVLRAVEQLHNHGVSLATIHGNDPIIRAAVAAKGDIGLLAVTVLTSFDEDDMRKMGLNGPVADLVGMRARKAVELGCDGVVCSALEVAGLRADLGAGFLAVTPGIRPADRSGGDDQRRIATPGAAIANGADHLVIGRPISTAADPLALIDIIQQEIAVALERRSKP
ncbi:MAG TPA: orotidine-5'-phosphate decarboxylase [Desulfurivibrio alkaliphilus]|uniref:Orotidine 5'-phosphate decarboxylase n=1 Tax=Desulfurivibrio alkaliphilus TaxID=427923 RepID=A0A7C2THB5_9BACT|nr:orotidine-5'-phosphate decarboxylase [Desulfurivibrio alkaliphilus]